MSVTLVVLAHPSPGSVSAAWTEASIVAARAAGHEVLVSDLYAQGFDPAERGAHYGLDGPFDPLKAQEEAARAGRLPPDVAAEIAKVEAADRVVLHFPLWWFAPPAMVKGWCDRVLVHGLLHQVDRRFDTGPCRGKTVLFCVTTGATAAEIGPRGKEGRLDLLLWPLAYTFRYCGFDVAEPLALHGVHGYRTGPDKARLEAAITRALSAQGRVIAGLDRRRRWQFHPDGDFDPDGRLAPGVAPLWPFHG